MAPPDRADDTLRERIRRLEERLAALECDVDAARGEMAPGDVDGATIREIASLSRELRDLRQRLRTR